MRWAIYLIIIVGLLYGSVVLLLYAQQDRLIYPAPDQIVPAQPWYEEVELQTEDGLALRSFYRPAERGQPTAIYFHGNGGSLMGSIHATRQMAEAGYGLLLVEYRGYGGNPGTPTEEGLYVDGRAALSFAREKGIEHSRLILIGNSLGTGVATQMAQEIAPLALILSAPFTSLPEAAAAKAPFVPATYLVTGQYNNAAKIAQVTAPILIQHGSADDLIHVSHGRALAGRAETASFQLFEGEGHALVFSPDVQQARGEWLSALH